MPARARTTDPFTSHEAAASISEPTLRRSQQAVLEVIGALGQASDDDLVTEYLNHHRLWPLLTPQQSPSGIRTRRHELAQMGMLERAPGTQRLATGRRARLWQIKHVGIAHG